MEYQVLFHVQRVKVSSRVFHEENRLSISIYVSNEYIRLSVERYDNR